MHKQTVLFEEELPKILDCIPYGRENAVSMRYLAAVLSTDARGIRRMVHDARSSGYVIIGNEHGYYKPQHKDDVIGWIKREMAVLKSKNKALQSARKALSEGRYPDEGEH